MAMRLESQVLEDEILTRPDFEFITSVWNQAKGSDFAPPYGDKFSLESFEPRLVPSFAMIDVIDGGKDFLYRFWGGNHLVVKGFELTGKLLSEAPIPEIATVGKFQFGEVLKRRKPVAFAYLGPYQDYKSDNQITARYPLSSDGQTINKILSYQNMNADHERWRELFEDLT